MEQQKLNEIDAKIENARKRLEERKKLKSENVKKAKKSVMREIQNDDINELYDQHHSE